MKRALYLLAIKWIAENDDTEWLADAEPIPSVTASLVADLFGIPIERVTGDLKNAVLKQGEVK